MSKAIKLPRLFVEIIELDRRNPCKEKVVDFDKYRAHRKVRQDYRFSAEKYIQRQKGPSTT